MKKILICFVFFITGHLCCINKNMIFESVAVSDYLEKLIGNICDHLHEGYSASEIARMLTVVAYHKELEKYYAGKKFWTEIKDGLIVTIVFIVLYLLFYHYKKNGKSIDNPGSIKREPPQSQAQSLHSFHSTQDFNSAHIPNNPVSQTDLNSDKKLQTFLLTNERNRLKRPEFGDHDKRLYEIVMQQIADGTSMGLESKNMLENIEDFATKKRRGNKKFMELVTQQIEDAKSIGLEPVYSRN